MYKEKLQELITENFLNDEIDTISYINLSESVENLSEGKLQVIKKALALSKRIKAFDKLKSIQTIKISKMTPGPTKDKAVAKLQKLQQTNNKLKTFFINYLPFSTLK